MTEKHKIPNIGWLDGHLKKKSGLLEGLDQSRFYFAHSYHVIVDKSEDELISAVYGYEFTVAIAHENIYGVQFHPEKSHRFGLQFLKNFGTLN